MVKLKIDIIAENSNRIYFIEVKSVASEHIENFNTSGDNVSHGTYGDYRPEENMHPWKLKRMARTIQTYLISENLADMEWQVDLLVVFLNLKDKSAKIKVVENIIL